jgi:hypothetical protein
MASSPLVFEESEKKVPKSHENRLRFPSVVWAIDLPSNGMERSPEFVLGGIAPFNHKSLILQRSYCPRHKYQGLR